MSSAVLGSHSSLIASEPAIQKGTRVLISLWDSLMFGRVPWYLGACLAVKAVKTRRRRDARHTKAESFNARLPMEPRIEQFSHFVPCAIAPMTGIKRLLARARAVVVDDRVDQCVLDVAHHRDGGVHLRTTASLVLGFG